MIMRHRVTRAFSLVEVLAAVAVIGIITFLAIPNIVQVKKDSEDSLAMSRAAALNMAQANYLRAKGDQAETDWDSAATDEAKYTALIPYLAFAPASFDEFVPEGYTFVFGDLDEAVTVQFPE